MTKSASSRIRAAQVATAVAAVLLLVTQLNPEHFPPWTSYLSEAPAFAAGALLLIAGALRGVSRASAPVLVLLAAALLAWVQWACGLVPYAGDAWLATAYIGVVAASWWWASEERPPEETPAALDLVVACCWLMGLLGAFQALAQWVQVEQIIPGWIYSSPGTNRSSGNLGQPNQLATVLMMSVVGSGVWIVRGKVGLVAGWAWLLLAGWAVVLTQSRTALVAAVALATVLAAASFYAPPLRRWNKHALAWLGWLVLSTIALQHMDWDVTRAALGTEAMVRVGLRPVIWAQMVDAIQQSPWFGYGWLQVSAAQQAGAIHVHGIEQVNYTHNLLLDILVMFGLPLGLLVIGAAVAWSVRRIARMRETDGTAFAAAMIVVPWLVHTQLELPHAYSYFLVPVGILGGVIECHTRRPGDWSLSVPRGLAYVLAAGFATMLASLAFDYAKVEEDFRVNRFENRRLGQTPPGYVYPELLMLTQFGDLLHAMRLRAAPGMSNEDLNVLVRITRRFTWAPLEFRAALALGLNGRPDEARRHLLVIQTLFPAEIVEDGRDNWRRLQVESPALLAVSFP